MMANAWRDFWSTYRYDGTVSNDRLFEQVGRTVNGKPISHEAFELSIRFITENLQLAPDDIVFEYCCGNGLVSHELARQALQVIGIDFTEHLVAAAKKFRQRENIRYFLGDALQPITPWIGDVKPGKFLMASALGHFDPAGLDILLENLCAALPVGTFQFLLTGIPDADRKWNFYDTPERKQRHLENVAAGNVINDGMGRWWTDQEIITIAERYRLSATIIREPDAISHYRMAANLR